MRWWSLLGLVVISAGCRQHVLEDGAYTLSLRQPSRDDCGLAGLASIPGTGMLTTAGHWVSFDASLFGQTMSGSYAPGTERLALEGVSSNVELAVGATHCRFDTARVSLEVVATDATRFTGSFQLATVNAARDECSCQLWASVDGSR